MKHGKNKNFSTKYEKKFNNVSFLALKAGMFLIFLPSEAGHILNMFLNFKFEPQRSY